MNCTKTNKWIGAVVALALLLITPRAIAQQGHDDTHASDTQSTIQVPQSGQIINAICPVTPEEDVDPAFTIEYKGQTIGFCCRKCRTRFNEGPEAYLAELPMLQSVSLTTNNAPNNAPGNAPNNDLGNASNNAPAHDDDHNHDHAVDHAASDSGFSKLIAWLGKFHPPATHLPIGMLIGAALAEVLFIMTKRDLFRNAGSFCMALAGAGVLAAVTLGWFNGGFTLVDDQWTQTVHRWLGTATTALTLLSIGMLIRASKPNAKPSAWLSYRVSLFAAAGMVGATGFFGGALVYGLNHYAW